MKYQWNRDEAREVLSLWGTYLAEFFLTRGSALPGPTNSPRR